MRTDLQSSGNPLDVVNRHVSFAAFYAAKIRAIHFDLIGEILLANAKRFSVAADIGCNDSPQASGMGAFHSSLIACKMAIRRRVLSIILRPIGNLE